MTDQSSLQEELDFALNDEAMFGANGVIPCLFETGDLGKVLVVSGENAGGKSFFCKALSSWAADEHKLEIIRVGMGKRTESGMIKSFMFGDEDMDSTGNISIKTVLTSFTTAQSRKSPNWVILDEPDIGVAAEFHQAIGQAILNFTKTMPETTQAFIIVSHAKELIRPLIDAGAMSVRVGGDLRPVKQWLNEPDQHRSIDELLALRDNAHKRYRAINDVMKSRREEKTSTSPKR